MLRHLIVRAVAITAAAAAAALASVAPAATSAASDCTYFASVSGSDAAAGTRVEPFRTAARLVGALAAGEVGCLLPGTFSEDLAIRRGGSPGSPITLRSAPDGRATLRGRFWVTDGANDVVVTELLLDGRNSSNLPSPTVNGDRVTFVQNEITNYHWPTICFNVGSDSGWGIAVDTVVERNRIHDCGALPATNKHHGVYLSNSRGARVVSNYIYDNADRGIQLYPDAQGTIVANNVIDGNGQGIIFSGEGGISSNDSRVFGNVISNSTIRYNVESWYPSGTPPGQNNLVTGNCVWNGKQGNVSEQNGFTVANALVADPLYVDRQAKDFRFRTGSPCASYGPAADAATPVPAVPEPAPAPAPVPAPDPAPAPAPVPAPDPAAPSLVTAPPAAIPTPSPEPEKPSKPRKPRNVVRATASTADTREVLVRKAGAVWIWWDGGYKTQTQLVRHLRSRGVGWKVWARRHPAAAHALRAGKLPA